MGNVSKRIQFAGLTRNEKSERGAEEKNQTQRSGEQEKHGGEEREKFGGELESEN